MINGNNNSVKIGRSIGRSPAAYSLEWGNIIRNGRGAKLQQWGVCEK